MKFRTLSLSAIAASVFVLARFADAAPPLALSACKIDGTGKPARCGTFEVAENRDRPDGRRLKLKVIVVPATSAHPREPIFFLSGGPGQPATDIGPDVGASWPDHDVVLLDLRGTGEGTALDCNLGGSDDDIQGYMEAIFADASRYADCAAELSKRADLTQYTTPIAMQDLDALRSALGYRKINLYGGSYGTRAALVYMQMFRSNVHAAHLSGLAPIADRSPLYHARAAQRALSLVFDQCAADATCHRAFPDPAADLAAIQATLRAKPARATVRHPVTGKPTEVSLTATGFADGLRVMLYSEERGRRVPLLLARARAGDYAPFAELAMLNTRALKQGLRLGLLLSVTCAEDVWRIRPEEVAKETAGSFIGDTRVRGQMAACAVWPRAKMPKDFYEPFVADVPTLIMSGYLDPVTPPEWGDEAKHALPNSLHIVLPGAHVSNSPCTDKMATTLFAAGSIKAIDTSCTKDISLPPFELPK